jgi:short-subunit dehydrogenase
MGDALVVGSSSGLGQALAKAYLARGYRVFGVARSAEHGITHPQFTSLQADIGQPDSAEAIHQWLESQGFGYDVLVLNAGAGHAGFAQNTPFTDIERLFSVNFFGLVRLFTRLMEPMQRLNKGTVLVISSLAAYRGVPGAGPYGATKAALSSLFESFQIDLQGTDIRIVQVFPYFVITKMSNPKAKPTRLLWSTPEEAAEKILRGVEKGRRSIAFPRFYHAVVKAWQVMPREWYFGFWQYMRRGG